MLVHLIRHGEVENPDHVVYADLPGFPLSAKGRRQALAVGGRLRSSPPPLIVTSPLERATTTARLISEATGSRIESDGRLTEWLLGRRWAGTSWDSLDEVFPGELEAYLQHPADLPFSPETLGELADRVAACVEEWVDTGVGSIAFVSHQDPIHAAYRVLTDRGFDNYHSSKPEHGAVLSLRRADAGWSPAGYWAPEQ